MTPGNEDVAARVNKINEPSPPPKKSDPLFEEEKRGMSAGVRADRLAETLQRSLKSQIDELGKRCMKQEKEIKRLAGVEIEHARYHVTHRVSKLFFLVCTPTILLGILLVGYTDGVTPSVGWGLVIVGCTVEFLMGLFNPHI